MAYHIVHKDRLADSWSAEHGWIPPERRGAWGDDSDRYYVREELPRMPEGGVIWDLENDRIVNLDDVPREPIPTDVYWSPEHANFYNAGTDVGMGEWFYERWRRRSAEFSQTTPERHPEPAPKRYSAEAIRLAQELDISPQRAEQGLANLESRGLIRRVDSGHV